ncbi:MAG: hypothetical protein JW839_22940 [Candidatus Lokiarchaeota archaeon]|nr:hypothetical protein [Candidatus Lokiarchaeota archaeon]
MDGRSVSDQALIATISVLNQIVVSGIPIDSIGTMKTTKVDATEDFILNVYFENGPSIQFKVTKIQGRYRTIFGPIPTEGRLSRIGRYERRMLFTESMLCTHQRRLGLSTFFSLIVDQSMGTRRAVRFDEWLIHNILGIPYDSPLMHIQNNDIPNQAYWDMLADAYRVIGVQTTEATRRAIQDDANDARIMRWFLLYASQSANRLHNQNGEAVCLHRWVAANVDEEVLGKTSDEILAMNSAQFADFLEDRLESDGAGGFLNDDAFWWLWGFGYDVGENGGYGGL